MAKNKISSSEVQIPLFSGLNISGLQSVETIQQDQAEKFVFDVVDFDDPDRSKSCLEVDFPILKVNEVAAHEASGPCTKPIYKMSKWWARRRSSIFRQLLIAASTKAPQLKEKASQSSWSLMYRKNHQSHKKFSKISVLDIFMGGGTTVVEASRLGFKVTGVDINPIAWWIVKNETTYVDPILIENLYTEIKAKVESKIGDFFRIKSPRGFHGKFESDASGVKKWTGPDLVYTFWMKHILCSDPDCNHLTPQVATPVIAEKKLSIKYLPDCVCPHCGSVFDLEMNENKIAPNATFQIGKDQSPFAYVTEKGLVDCPDCNKKIDAKWVSSQKTAKKEKSKKVSFTLLLEKKWLKGISGKNKSWFGGFVGATNDQNKRWMEERQKNLNLIEIRGEVSKDLLSTNYASDKIGDKSSGNIVCGGCGRVSNPLDCIKVSGHLAPIFPYAVHGFDPEAKKRKFGYNGRFFDLPDFELILKADQELSNNKELWNYIPQQELFYGYKTHHWAIPDHGYTHWYKMFTQRQLLIHASLLKEIESADDEKYPKEVKSQLLGAFQNYLRHNCVFTLWNIQADQLEPHFMNNNYHPKATFVENSIFSDLGRGNFSSCKDSVIEGMRFINEPFDIIKSADEDEKTNKVPSLDKIKNDTVNIICGSSTDLKSYLPNKSVDLIITDPPFGDNINYAELADFFLVWLNRPLSKIFPTVFTNSESPKSLEAVTNKARHPGKSTDGKANADLMYDRLLTLCWKESARVLKDGGILAFTFHHDQDVAWIGVLESLFNAGFLIEATFPVRSDAKRGDGHVGAQKIEFDIVHVCKKRINPPVEIYWASLRKKIVASVKNKASILAQHRLAGLSVADIEILIRGEVLVQYSEHYGVVKRNLSGDSLSIRDIFIEANSITQNLLEMESQDKVPDLVDPETRVFLSIFRQSNEIEIESAQKKLKGLGVTVDDFKKLGYLAVDRVNNVRVVRVEKIQDRWASLSRKKHLATDLDQVHFSINCCLGGKQLDGKPADLETWIESNYKNIFPSVVPLLKYMEGNHFGAEYKQAIGMAYRTLERTLNRIKETDGEYKKASDQLSLFE